MRLSIRSSLAAVAMLLLAGCSSSKSDGERLSVVASFYPLEYFSARIVGDHGVVTNLVKPGIEPHDFEPTADDLKLLTAADVLVYNGLGLEPWLDRALASIKSNDLILVATGEAIGAEAVRQGLDEEGRSGTDPHVWLDPQIAIRQVEAIRDALKRAEPAGTDDFERNAAGLIADLDALDQRFKQTLSSCRLKTFVTAHEAFGYLADRYGLKQIGITGIEQEEPDPEQLARIVDAVRANNVKFVLTEPGPSPRIAETLAREVGAQVRELDPVEFPAEGGDYLTAMERNRTVLSEVLECDG
jgi:zinc transport system substrate-binding protein